MSLFQAREWWSTYAGNDEEFDSGNLCVSNIDNSQQGHDKIIVGSFHGILRIFYPKSNGFKPSDLMVETQLPQPILQVASGKFSSGTEDLHLAVLHPRKLAVYCVSAVSGSVEHGNYYSVKLVYEHILERTSHSMTFGPFGNVKAKDFICVQSMDGMLSFFEQETYTFGRFLPNFLLPGPLEYISGIDSFVICSSARNIECYKYESIAVSSDKLTPKSLSGKKLAPDWSTNIGENAISIKYANFAGCTPSILILGERSIFSLLENGTLHFMKKFEYNPSSFLPYASLKDGKLNTLVSSHTNTLLIYEDVSLVWAAQLPHVPVALRIANFQDLKATIVSLDEYGHLYCSYMGTDPSLFVAPPVDARELNYEELDREMKTLQKAIKESTSTQAVAMPKDDDLSISVEVPDHMDEVSQAADLERDNDEIQPSITVKVTLSCTSSTPIENVIVNMNPPFPIKCDRQSFDIPIIGDRSPTVSYFASFFTFGGSIPASLNVTATATFFTNSDAPRVVQCTFDLPLSLICFGCAPVKQAQHKLTIDTNKDPVSLAELFPEIVEESVIPVSAIGFQYYKGPVVTVLSSKTSNRYRLQCDLFEGLWPIVDEQIKRLKSHFSTKKEGSPFKASFSGPLPLNEYYELIDGHFEQRQSKLRFKDLLAQRAHQFRVIQRRLLTRFKDKTPAPLANLDVLLEGTYRQLLALGEAAEDAERQCMLYGNALCCGTKLLNLLIRLWNGMNEKQFDILASCLSPVVSDADDQGWEETTDAAITHLLKTCLAKSSKDQSVSIQPLSMPKDTAKLKKHIALMCERLNKGAKLDLNGQGDLMHKGESKAQLETLDESIEENEDKTDGVPEDVAVTNHENSNRPMERGNSLPKLKSKLDKRVLIGKDSKEAAILAKAAARAQTSNGQINGEQ